MADGEDWTDRQTVVVFTRMVRTIVLIVLWVVITFFTGIALGLAFFEDPEIPIWLHIIFYTWVVITAPIVVWIIKKKIWKL